MHGRVTRQTLAAGRFRACVAGEYLLAILARYLKPSQRFSAGNRSDKLQEHKVVEVRSGLFLDSPRGSIESLFDARRQYGRLAKSKREECVPFPR
jgi:hypothetical protein